jgi:Fic family protein
VGGYAPRYSLTTATLACAEALGAARATFELRALPLPVERALRHRVRTQVAHNSTWIENRTLTLHEAEAALADRPPTDPSRAKEKAAQEVRNYFQALDLIEHSLAQPPSEPLICRLHATIMSGLLQRGRPPEASPYRRGSVRVGVYLAPMWEDVPALMQALVAWACGPGRALPGYLFAGIFAYQFVTIHPFSDGNGRTSRALATWALRRSGYDPRGLFNVEEFYARNLEGYHDALQMGMHPVYDEANERGSRSDPDLTPWLDFFCEAVATAARERLQAPQPRAP